MTSSSAVLAVIDVQNGFITEQSRPVVPVIADLVARWQANGGDTLFTRYSNYPGSPFERLLGYTELHTEPATRLVDELIPYAEHATCTVDKAVYSLFTDAGVAVVQKYGWTDLYICGIDTECCVLKTAVDAFERNLTPWVLADACMSHSDRESHDAGLIVTRKLIGDSQVITVEQLSGELPGRG